MLDQIPPSLSFKSHQHWSHRPPRLRRLPQRTPPLLPPLHLRLLRPAGRFHHPPRPLPPPHVPVGCCNSVSRRHVLLPPPPISSPVVGAALLSRIASTLLSRATTVAVAADRSGGLIFDLLCVALEAGHPGARIGSYHDVLTRGHRQLRRHVVRASVRARRGRHVLSCPPQAGRARP
ncbi:hypothetical protein ZWY2020_000776 [Hordeum vulgare]|nr:hypothetical protein ZWY2020_000776 [Hordeum vulgare]